MRPVQPGPAVIKHERSMKLERGVREEHRLKTQLAISLARNGASYRMDVLSGGAGRRHVSSVSQPLNGADASSIPSSEGK